MVQQTSLVFAQSGAPDKSNGVQTPPEEPGNKFVKENPGVREILTNEGPRRTPDEKKAIGRELRKAADKIDPPAPAPGARPDPKKI